MPRTLSSPGHLLFSTAALDREISFSRVSISRLESTLWPREVHQIRVEVLSYGESSTSSPFRFRANLRDESTAIAPQGVPLRF